jgi:hypothetical protein
MNELFHLNDQVFLLGCIEIEIVIEIDIEIEIEV